MNAAAKRQMAMGMLTELYLSQGTDSPYLWSQCEGREATPAEVAENIKKLAQLGRTERWQDTITRWAAMVTAPETDNDPKALRWAYMQGLIYACHVAS